LHPGLKENSCPDHAATASARRREGHYRDALGIKRLKLECL
jgi:hypothetical protein